MAQREVILLGDDRLYQVSEEIDESQVYDLRPVIHDLRDTLKAFRAKYGAGRAIAAPQIGVAKRLIYMDTGSPRVIMNPEIVEKSEEMMEVWDDCMCFPDLLVRVMRHSKIKVKYRDIAWHECQEEFEGDLAELVQHEYDHLDGVLAVMRAIDGKSFALRSVKRRLG